MPRKLWTQLRLSWEILKNPPNVLFVPSHIPPIIHPKKLICTIHDLGFKKFPKVYSKKELILQKWGTKYILKKAWKIIVPSEFTKSEIYKYYPKIAQNNIYVVPHGVDHNKFKIKNQKSKIKNIVYIGRLEHKKNIINLIKAFNILNKNYQLTLIGSPGYGYADIKREINKLPQKHNIHELGWLDRKKIIDYLTNASIFVFPSLYEGFGMPLLEAMACGVPIACSDIPPLREVGTDIPVYFNPAEPLDMADKINQLIDNKKLRQKKVQQGLKNAQQFTWKSAAKKTLDIIST